MHPTRIDEDGVPVFTSSQVDDYGFPEHWGYDVYRIVENRDTMEFKTDFKMETSYYKRPIHRYDRRLRFYNTLLQLMGDRGKVPQHILQLIGAYLKPGDEWNQVRRMLKHYRLRIYYNRIPFIVQQLTKQNSVNKVHVDQYNAIMKEFDRFCFWYDKHKDQFRRTYFPNMRFLALKLMHTFGVTTNYEIPLTRTQRKRKDLEFIWNEFIQQ